MLELGTGPPDDRGARGRRAARRCSSCTAPAASRPWDGVLPLLVAQLPRLRAAAPGFGRSTGLELLDDQLDLFFHGFDVMEALGLERPYVVGESMGGWIAAEMAALRPKEIGRLALAAPIGLWRDEAPVVDLFGHMTHELVPFLFHDTSCPAAQQMLGVDALISDKDDRTEEQVEMLHRPGARLPHGGEVPLPDPRARARAAAAAHHRADAGRVGRRGSLRRAVVRRASSATRSATRARDDPAMPAT